ncbi:MAG: hypothetical protein Sylvanvirus43_5 [Sylvanvirus sp.]|uniref:Uncharacterized protein n=1 Tax=Sylvanvirus sp. TaxID=2487774 RepID=A0A3G5AMJ1_9VIRU|nr:MAG: hypothetical protein Sylvanvirus43_5 [Sylvanvirus sp.]
MCDRVITKEIVLHKKHRNEYFPDTLNIVEIVLVKPGKTLPVGSARSIVHKYPSDIDIMERVTDCCTLNSVRLDFMRALQAIILQIQQSSSVFLADFKAGFDTRYQFYIGEVDISDTYVTDYNASIIQNEINNLKQQTLLTNDEYQTLCKLNETMNEDPTVATFYEISDYLRTLYVVRWTAQEILQGYKRLRKNKRLSLIDALSSQSIVKLDIWAPLPFEDLVNCGPHIIQGIVQDIHSSTNPSISQRYVEVTNYWILNQLNLQGDRHSLTEPLGDYARNLKRDVAHYLTSVKSKNSLKAAKRFWSLLMYIYSLEARVQIMDILLRLSPLFSSFPALLNSIASDLELMTSIVEKHLSVGRNFIRRSLTGELQRLACYSCADKDPSVIQGIQQALTLQLKSSYWRKEVIETLVKDLRVAIEQETEEYLNTHQLDILTYIKQIKMPNVCLQPT